MKGGAKQLYRRRLQLPRGRRAAAREPNESLSPFALSQGLGIKAQLLVAPAPHAPALRVAVALLQSKRCAAGALKKTYDCIAGTRRPLAVDVGVADLMARAIAVVVNVVVTAGA